MTSRTSFRQQTRHAAFALLLRLSVVISAGIALALTAGSGRGVAALRPVGDPGGQILHQLSSLARAVPKGSPRVHAAGMEPHLTHSCTSTIPGVAERVTFVSRQSVQRVDAEVAANLRHDGWVDPTTSSGEWYTVTLSGRQVLAENYIFRWTRQLKSDIAAVATLQVGVPLKGWRTGQPLAWFLGALSPGVGEPPMHCGGP